MSRTSNQRLIYIQFKICIYRQSISSTIMTKTSWCETCSRDLKCFNLIKAFITSFEALKHDAKRFELSFSCNRNTNNNLVMRPKKESSLVSGNRLGENFSITRQCVSEYIFSIKKNKNTKSKRN